ncbi:MAG: hypothetical protein WCO63_13795 [Bacteroidota bacterium]
MKTIVNCIIFLVLASNLSAQPVRKEIQNRNLQTHHYARLALDKFPPYPGFSLRPGKFHGGNPDQVSRPLC